MIDVQVGDYAVIFRTYRYVAVKVEKVTAQQVKASGEWSGRASTYSRINIEYAGPEEQAKALVERLTSSLALFEDDRRKAGERRDARNAALIDAALTARNC